VLLRLFVELSLTATWALDPFASCLSCWLVWRLLLALTFLREAIPTAFLGVCAILLASKLLFTAPSAQYWLPCLCRLLVLILDALWLRTEPLLGIYCLSTCLFHLVALVN